ncbi:MAG: S8/S53 family peptidase [Myxococcales bacterium]|nr:S8/S53 family peptidase [Myxococcales bacterium]
MMSTAWIIVALTGCEGPDTSMDDRGPAESVGMRWVGRIPESDPANPFDRVCFTPEHDPDLGWQTGLLFDVDPDDCSAGPGCLTDQPPEVAVMVDSDPENPSQPVEAAWVDMPTALRDYCVHIPTPSTRYGVPTEGGQAPYDLDVVRSVMAVGRAATPPPPVTGSVPAPTEARGQLATRQSERTKQQVCFLPFAPEGSTGPGAHEIWLTLFDTDASAAASRGLPLNTHGNALLSILDDTLCQDGVCDEDIVLRHRSALPLRAVDGLPEWHVEDHGYFGSLDWLAQAIVREIRAVDQHNATKPDRPARLVLNLSIAWHPDYNDDLGTSTGTERPDVAAVHDALRYATCSGALIFASVGNRTGADGSNKDDGPMYPAAWADELVVDEDCARFDFPDRALNERPLLYAVGAVGADNEPLGLSRPGSQPPLLAFGRQAISDLFLAQQILEEPPNPEFTAMTGTSVATAIVSAAAARAWAENTELEDPALVVDRMVEWAEPLDTTEPTFDVYPQLSSRTITGQHASVRVGAPPNACGPGALPAVVVPSRTEGPAAFRSSGNELATVRPTTAFSPYAEDANKYVQPTPQPTLCPTCGVELGKTGFLILDFPLFATDTTMSVNLVLSGPGGGTQHGVTVSHTQSTEPQVYTVPVDAPDPSRVSRAVVHFEVDGVTYMSEIDVLGR